MKTIRVRLPVWLVFARTRLREIFLAGLATDFCVRYSAVDACRLGFTTVLIEAGCRAIDLAGSLDAAWAGMAAAGVQRIGDLG